jgi:glycosyltransferase involved in cell wall biosynthesis
MVSVVVPVFNEEENVPVLYREIADALKGQELEIIFTDDGSTDKTFEVLKKLREGDPQIKIIKLQKNCGQSAALAAGIEHARGEIIATLDGDRQNNPADIPMMIEKLKEGYDFVAGWRFNRKDTFFKKRFSRFGYRLRKLIIGKVVHDSGCTLRVYKAKVIRQLELMGEMHRYISEMLMLQGYSFAEVKVDHRPRTAGKTKYNLRRLPKGFLDLLMVATWQKYRTRPLHLLGGIGLIAVILGFLIGIYLVIYKFATGADIGSRPLLLLSVLLITTGIQFVILGFLADLMTKIYHSGDKREYTIEKIEE